MVQSDTNQSLVKFPDHQVKNRDLAVLSPRALICSRKRPPMTGAFSLSSLAYVTGNFNCRTGKSKCLIGFDQGQSSLKWLISVCLVP